MQKCGLLLFSLLVKNTIPQLELFIILRDSVLPGSKAEESRRSSGCLPLQTTQRPMLQKGWPQSRGFLLCSHVLIHQVEWLRQPTYIKELFLHLSPKILRKSRIDGKEVQNIQLSTASLNFNHKCFSSTNLWKYFFKGAPCKCISS